MMAFNGQDKKVSEHANKTMEQQRENSLKKTRHVSVGICGNILKDKHLCHESEARGKKKQG